MRLVRISFVILVGIAIAVGCTKKVADIKAANESISTQQVPGYPRAEDLNSVTLPPGLGGSSLGSADSHAATSVLPPSTAFLPKARASHSLAHAGKRHGKRHHHKRKH